MPDLGPHKEKIAKLLRMLSSSGGERRNAFAALERTMQSEGITWSDIGNVIERAADGKYTEEEMQQFALAVRKEGVEEGIKIGLARVQTQQQSNGHISLPEPSKMASYCQQRLSQLKDDAQREFIKDVYATTRRGRYLQRGPLGYLASIYIKNDGRI